MTLVTVGDRQGTGVIVHSGGLILTVANLVGKATTASVTLDDKRSFDATVWGLDEVRNLAILRIPATGLPAAKMGDSSKLALDQRIVVVGYDSGTSRPAPRLGSLRGFRTSAATGLEYIETDAAAGSGSQGGPAVNLQGEMVGLFVYASPFTIPNTTHAATTNTISSYVDKLKRGAKFFKETPFASFPPGPSVPPLPASYAGTVAVDGKPAPEGTLVVAVVGEYVPRAAVVSGGSYRDLLVGPPYGTYDGMRITFYVDGFAAAETQIFRSGVDITRNLTVTTPPPP